MLMTTSAGRCAVYAWLGVGFPFLGPRSADKAPPRPLPGSVTVSVTVPTRKESR
jgi:hypothetical protein